MTNDYERVLKMIIWSMLFCGPCPHIHFPTVQYYLIKNSQAVKKGAAPKKAMVKKDVKSKVAAKKWL